MGMFLALSGIVGKSKDQVISSLERYAQVEGGGLEEKGGSGENEDLCIVEERYGNTSISYPRYFDDWEKASAFISKDLNGAVFSFHIHDGDFWMSIKKLNLPYALEGEESNLGSTYKFWTAASSGDKANDEASNIIKPWWKFWS